MFGHKQNAKVVLTLPHDKVFCQIQNHSFLNVYEFSCRWIFGSDESDDADVSEDDNVDEPENRRRQDAAKIAETVDDLTIIDADGRDVAECRDEFKSYDSVKSQVAA